MNKLVYLIELNPIMEDKIHRYSRLRFYSDTIVKFAEKLCCDEVEILHHTNISKYSDKELLDEFNDNPENFENCNYLKETLLARDNILPKFDHIDNFTCGKDDHVYVMFGILNGPPKYMKEVLDDYSEVIWRSDGYFYMSSDGELTAEQYILRKDVSFLTLFPTLDPAIFNEKLLSVILTEVKDTNVVKNYESIGIGLDRLHYLPMIIDTSGLGSLGGAQLVRPKNNKVMLLRGFKEWMTHEDYLNVLKGRTDIYESSMPAMRKQLLPTCERYSIKYNHARFWTKDKMMDLLNLYDYYIGASSPRSSRFTYKLPESVCANTVCLLPWVSLNALKDVEGTSECQRILNKYSHLFVLSDPNQLNEVLSETETEKTSRLCDQMAFLCEYFDIDSDNINRCMRIIQDKVWSVVE